MELTQEYLKTILDYNPETGILMWKERADVAPNVNARFANKEAGCKAKSGYLLFGINGKTYYVHIIAYFMYHGVWPEKTDHENHIRDDNKIKNLKSVTFSQNNKNHKKSKANSSGHTGVHFFKRDQNWQSSIYVEGKHKHLGYFTDLGDAIAARKEAEIKHEFHPNHGQ